MHSLHWVDYTIIIAFLAVTVFFGLIMTRKASQSLEHYFLGGRKIPWYFLGISGMTNWFDLTGTMIITSFLFMLGPRGLYIEFRGGAALVLAFMMAYTAKWHRRSGCITGVQWYKYRFGEDGMTNALRLLSVVMGVVGTVGMLAYLVRGTSLFLGIFFPWPPMYMTFGLIFITAVYTMLSGFYGVVLTDVIQGTIIMVACVVVGFMAWNMIPSFADLAEQARLVTGNANWGDTVPGWTTTMPRGYEVYESIVMFALFYLVRNVLGGLGTGAEQRYFAAASDKECGLQTMLQGITITFRWPMMIGFAVMGIYLVGQMLPGQESIGAVTELIRTHFPEVTAGNWHDLTSHIANAPQFYPGELIDGIAFHLGDAWMDKLPLVGYAGAVNPEQILPAVMKNVIPLGLRGILVMAMMAALMSTLNATVNGISSVMVKDLYQNLLRPKASTRELIFASWGSTLLVVLAGFWMGISARSINDLWGWIVMGLGAGGLAPGLLRLYWWRCNTAGMFGGILLGGAGAVVQRLVMPELVEWKLFLLISCLSLLGTVGLSLLTRPTPDAVLRNFYRTTRPFGWWRPYRDALSPEEQLRTRRENRNDLISIPIIMVCQIALFLLPMQLVIKAYPAFLATLPVFLISAFGVYRFWWRPLRHADQSTLDNHMTD